ncbi:MAG: FecR domain-containing protein [Pseudomonadota bacterium]
MSDSLNVVPLRDDDPIDVEASQWLAQLDAGPLSDEKRAAFKRWLAGDDRRIDAFRDCLAFWEELDDVVANLAVEVSSDQTWRSGEVRAPVGRFRSFAPVLSALSVVFVLVAVFVFQRSASFTARYVIEAGSVETASLPDGSSIAMNSGTRMRVDFNADRRQLILQSGEALFDVAHDAERPFVVLAGDRYVEAVGTAFVVRLDDEVTRIAVEEGIVRIGERDTRIANDTAPDRVSDKMLRSGHEIIINDDTEDIVSIEPDALSRRLAWTEGRMVFDGEPLETVIKEFARHSTLTIELQDPELSRLKVSGSFPLGNDDAFLSALEAMFDMQVRIAGDDFVYLAAPGE